MQRDWDAEHRELMRRRQAARDHMMRLSPAQNVTPGDMPISTTDELARYSAAKAEVDAIEVEVEAFNNDRAGSGK